MIKHRSISSHRDYGKRMLLSFNKEIQSGYYQNTLVSIEGALPTRRVQHTHATLATGLRTPSRMPPGQRATCAASYASMEMQHISSRDWRLAALPIGERMALPCCTIAERAFMGRKSVWQAAHHD